MEWLLDQAERIIPFAAFLWLALLTYWVWRLNGALGRRSDSQWRSNGWDRSQDSGFVATPPPPPSGPHFRWDSSVSGGSASNQLDRDPGRRPARHPAKPAEPALVPVRPAPPRPGAEKEKRLIIDFNRLAAGFSPEALQRFESEWTPIAVDEMSEGRFAATDGGALWFVSTDADNGWGAILPGADIVRKWEKFYRNLRGASAPAGLTASYTLVDGSILQVRDPALARNQAGDIRIESQGTLAGI